MASRRWVVNASPLILLGKTDNLHLLAGLADVVAVPRAVAKEVGTKPDGESTLQILARNPTFARADDETVSPEILSWDLGAGLLLFTRILITPVDLLSSFGREVGLGSLC